MSATTTYTASDIDPHIDALAKQASEALQHATTQEKRANALEKENAELRRQLADRENDRLTMEKVAADQESNLRSAEELVDALVDRQLIEPEFHQKIAAELASGLPAALSEFSRIINHNIPPVTRSRGMGVEKNASFDEGASSSNEPPVTLTGWFEEPASASA